MMVYNLVRNSHPHNQSTCTNFVCLTILSYAVFVTGGRLTDDIERGEFTTLMFNVSLYYRLLKTPQQHLKK